MRLLLEVCYGYFLVPSLITIKHPCHQFSRHQFPCSSISDEFNNQPMGYRIYSINRPGCLLNFWTLRVGTYLRWALIRGWALIKFSPSSANEVCLFCNKTINANNKTRRSNKARFLQNTLKKTPSPGKSLIGTYSLKWVGWG